MTTNKTKCKYKNCENETWLGVCNGYCVEHHNEVCMGINPTINKTSEWEKKFEKLINKYREKEEYFDLVDGYIPLETFIRQLLNSQREEIVQKLPEKKEFANKILRFLTNKYPNEKHCAFIEENLCDECDKKLAISKFVLEEIIKNLK